MVNDTLKMVKKKEITVGAALAAIYKIRG